VAKTDLTLAADEVVSCLMLFGDADAIPSGAVASTQTVMSVDGSSWIVGSTYSPVKVLKSGWREPNKTQILSYEANRRIIAVFPDYSQRNANAELNGYITQYGTNTSTWPAYNQQRNAEITRCWNYVNAVRQNANGMGTVALPADPTDDSHWPTVISPYVPS
jgi:hypothetical protein